MIVYYNLYKMGLIDYFSAFQVRLFGKNREPDDNITRVNSLG
jgi:hypothetical protein